MLNSVVVHSINMSCVSGQAPRKTYSWLNRYEKPVYSYPSITPSCTLHNVTLTSEHVIQTPDKCNDKKPQLHSFGNLCCNPYKHLVESVKMCAAWGRQQQVWPGVEEPCPPGQGPLPQPPCSAPPGTLLTPWREIQQVTFLHALSPQLRYYCSSLFSIYDL